MFKKNIFLIALFCLSIVCSSFKQIETKKLIGNWKSNVDLYDLKTGDTITFSKIKITDKTYQWGGVSCGIQLEENGSFSEYHNVLCSSESSPLRYSDEKWQQTNDLLLVNCSQRQMVWKIIEIKNKTFKIVVTRLLQK